MNKEQVLKKLEQEKRKREHLAETGQYVHRTPAYQSMHYQPRLNRFKSTNVYFNCDAETAWSYDWWCFVKRVGPYLVFNGHRYSVSTGKHQSKVRRVLSRLGLKIDLEIDTRCGLHSSDCFTFAIEKLENEIKALLALINTPKTHKAKNIERVKEIAAKKKHIKAIKRVRAVQKREVIREMKRAA